MGSFRDLKRQVFGRLTAISRAANGKHGQTCWLCRCECGTKTVVDASQLVRGRTRSCGCLHRELASFRYREGWDHTVAAQIIPKKVRIARAKKGAQATAKRRTS